MLHAQVIEMRDINKILGCLVGGAAGDALGYAIEFNREDWIFSRYGSTGISEYELTNGKAIISSVNHKCRVDSISVDIHRWGWLSKRRGSTYCCG